MWTKTRLNFHTLRVTCLEPTNQNQAHANKQSLMPDKQWRQFTLGHITGWKPRFSLCPYIAIYEICATYTYTHTHCEQNKCLVCAINNTFFFISQDSLDTDSVSQLQLMSIVYWTLRVDIFGIESVRRVLTQTLVLFYVTVVLRDLFTVVPSL